MRLRLTSRAHRDLVSITSYLAEDQRNPRAARIVLERIERALARIQAMPRIGRESARPDTRELSVPGLPFIVVYRLRHDTIEVLTVFHTSQDPNKKLD